MDRDRPDRNPMHQPGFESDTHATVIGPNYGIRAFNIDPSGIVLTGITYGYRWTPGLNTAQCQNPTRLSVNARTKHRRAQVNGTKLYRFTIAGWPFSANVYPNLPPIEPGPDDRAHSMKDCSCGFWSFHDPRAAGGYVRANRVSGIIEFSGRCVPGEMGWRSVHARIVALRPAVNLPALIWEDIAAVYDVPVYRTDEEMVNDFPLTKPDDWMLPKRDTQ
ncbi:MAG TPA: hypothetical protein VK054_03885 [Beutenbergiaceae bacterium]|nr:hypothetical protein [Beutenbergiaceae bacterium]